MSMAKQSHHNEVIYMYQIITKTIAIHFISTLLYIATDKQELSIYKISSSKASTSKTLLSRLMMATKTSMTVISILLLIWHPV